MARLRAPGRDKGRQDEPIVRSYARSLWALADGLARRDERFRPIADEIAATADKLDSPDPGRPDYSTFVALEIGIHLLMLEPDRERHYWQVRERFDAVASREARSWHDASRPLAGPDGSPLEGEARSMSRDADTVALLHSIGRCHLVHWGREEHIDGVRLWIARTVALGFGAVFVAGALLYLVLDLILDQGYPASSVHVSKTYFIGLIAVCFMGFLGAAMSTIRRLQLAVANEVKIGAPQLDAASLQYGKRTIRLGMVSGAVFALLLYLVFASGAGALIGLNEGLFPALPASSDAQVAAARLGYDGRPLPEASLEGSAEEKFFRFSRRPPKEDRPKANTASPPACYPSAGPSCGWFTLIASRLGFVSASDFLKMLVWAFIAGFAERLIPDAIDRVVSRRNQQAT